MFRRDTHASLSEGGGMPPAAVGTLRKIHSIKVDSVCRLCAASIFLFSWRSTPVDFAVALRLSSSTVRRGSLVVVLRMVEEILGVERRLRIGMFGVNWRWFAYAKMFWSVDERQRSS